MFDIRAHLQRQRDWSERTFGPGDRAKGVVKHIRKELQEIEADPGDLCEWIDVVILALDGAWRAGYSPDEIICALVAKQIKNENRVWPDWQSMPTDAAIEHVREMYIVYIEDYRIGHIMITAQPDGFSRDARCSDCCWMVPGRSW